MKIWDSAPETVASRRHTATWPAGSVMRGIHTFLTADRIRPYVSRMIFISDIAGEQAGVPIRTAPTTNLALTINIGRPNELVGFGSVPRTAVSGMQDGARSWRSWPETHFIMAMLTVSGVARLFPDQGEAIFNRVIDLGALIGDRHATELLATASGAFEPHLVAAALETWLTRRLDMSAVPGADRSIAAAAQALSRGSGVEQAARVAGTTRRQLHRWFKAHAGIGPKRFADTARSQLSVSAVQTDSGNDLAGFSDQAHQIRDWRARVGLSPTSYRRVGPSPLASGPGAELAYSGETFWL